MEDSIYIPSLAKINLSIERKIKENVKEIVNSIIKKLAEGEELNYEEMLEKYAQGYSIDSKIGGKMVKLSDNERCTANVKSNGSLRRCSRRRKDEKYCGGHKTRRPYGEINVK